MSDFHGIIFAYNDSYELRDLVSRRTAASIPFCGRYRVIDFTLSSLMNAGILDVGVIMQRDFQSLLDHIGSGKPWDMSRSRGGLHLLPPFGVPGYHTGSYAGTIEALNAVAQYIREIPQKYLVLMQGDVLANIDLKAAIESHLRSGAPITAIVTDDHPGIEHERYIVGSDGFVQSALFGCRNETAGYASMESYIVSKDLLLGMMDSCRAKDKVHFHRDALREYFANGGRMNTYLHVGYSMPIRSVSLFYRAGLDMLNSAKRHDLFVPERPVRTKHHEGVSTYYGEHARSKNSLVGDNSYIEGSIENCVLSSEVKVEEGAVLRNCIIMRSCTVGAGAKLDCVIADKDCSFAPGTVLTGNENLPIVVPKGSHI